MPPMPTRSILVRVALAILLLAGLVVLADSIARQELREATGGTAMADATVNAQPAGALDDE